MGAPTGASTGTARVGSVVHVVAELTGVALQHLHDSAMLGGLLIAAAGAAGMHAIAPPLLRVHATRGVDAMLMLDGGHATVHAYADRRALLVDLLAPEPAEVSRALDVFARRLAPAVICAQRLVRFVDGA